MKIISALIGAALLVASVTAASAVPVVNYVKVTDWSQYDTANAGVLPTGALSMSIPATSNSSGTQRSPFQAGGGTPDAPNWQNLNFFVVNPSTTATLTFAAANLTSFSFLWGSPDGHNTIDFLDSSLNVVGTVSTAILSASPGYVAGTGAILATITNINPFKYVRFSATGVALEFSFIAAVPVPAGVLLLGTGLAGLGFLGRRFKKSKSAMAAA
ncbi:MAG: VPLPA-CTERM sorting domain-containing protein [Devosia sp.]